MYLKLEICVFSFIPFLSALHAYNDICCRLEFIGHLHNSCLHLLWPLLGIKESMLQWILLSVGYNYLSDDLMGE